MTEKRIYRVTIPYREPLFDKQRDAAERTYDVDYDVVAADSEEARSKAFEEFFSDTANSDVGWDRIPDNSKVVVKLLADSGLSDNGH